MKNRIHPYLHCVALSAVLSLLLTCCSDPDQVDTPAKDDAKTPPALADLTAVAAGYAGTSSCRECHEKFYQLWAPSHHGKAMQPCTPEFLEKELEHKPGEIVKDKTTFRTEFKNGKGYVIEEGPEGNRSYQMVHAMGGKNVFFILTPLEKGRLQVLPMAFKVKEKEWYDTTTSMLHGEDDEALHWKDPMLTFNTSCFNCHVSQLSTNYDAETESYQTTWIEPGINCETCHNSAAEHVRVCREAPEGQPPADLKILSYDDLDVEQTNTTCALCHAKSQPISTDFKAGDLFFDHADLVMLEHEHYYPDGRDSGENYTYTSWLMSPCVKDGKMTCIHCHTSSGRYRFKGKEANNACTPCHQERVKNAKAHHRHAVGKPGSRCIDCHMPMTAFAHMNRSDHSMRPPMPAATLRFKSPNACNLCHKKKDAKWALEQVRKWHKRDYQAGTMHWAGLIEAGRKGDWSRLDEMLAFVNDKKSDDVVVASMLRLLTPCADQRVEQALIAGLKDEAPLIRASAANAFVSRQFSKDAEKALVEVAGDRFRVVRVRVGSALDGRPLMDLSAEQTAQVGRAISEQLAALTTRKDQWSSHYNLGNHFMRKGQLAQAAEAFERSIRLRSDVVPPLVNAAIVYAQLGQNEKAERVLRQALKADPRCAAANFNLGLLLAEKGDRSGAERALSLALEVDPKHAGAAHNLGVLYGARDLEKCLASCRKAWQLAPNDPKYAWTYGFYLYKAGQVERAIAVLEGAIERAPAHVQVYELLAQIHIERQDFSAAQAVCQKAFSNQNLPDPVRFQFAERAKQLGQK